MERDHSYEQPNGNEVEAHIIIPGVPFRPFEKAEQFLPQEETETPLTFASIPSKTYIDVPVLSETIEYQGTRGAIDIIPEYSVAEYMANLPECYPIETPLGKTHFKTIYHRSSDKTEVIEQPHILRFSFFPSTPREYDDIINTYFLVEIGVEKYWVFWHYNPSVRKTLEDLESGDNTPLSVVEINLFNVNWIERHDERDNPDVGGELEDDVPDIGRVSFIWLLKDISLLQTIRVTLLDLDDGDDESKPQEPVTPKEELIPA